MNNVVKMYYGTYMQPSVRVVVRFCEAAEVEADQFSGLGTGAIPQLPSPKTSHALCCGMTDV